MDLLIATRNPGKVTELTALLGGLPVRLRALAEFPEIAEVEETGATFAENAELKASAYARASGIWALADDSGLEVDSLGGAPGVLSARYAGGRSDSERVEYLLREIGKTNNADRSARFVCTIALVDETGQIMHRAEGVCEGMIAAYPRGNCGFGYDPVFIPEGFEQTFGELPVSIKQEISHRARAISQIFGFLRDFTAL